MDKLRSEDRIYGNLAYGDVDQVKETLKLIRVYSYDDYLILELRLELSYAVSLMKNLRGNKQLIVELILDGYSSLEIADEIEVSVQYVRRTRNEFYSVLREYFSKVVPLEDYKRDKKIQSRYRSRLSGYSGIRQFDQVDNDYTNPNYENETDKYPVNDALLERDAEYYKDYKGLEKDPE